MEVKKLPKTFNSVQGLRGLAALAVVIYHGDLSAIEGHLGPTLSFQGGESGVDLFFAISGCVMVASTAKFWGDLTAWRVFLLRRLIRVAPLYWIFTLLKIGSILFFSGFIRHSVLTWPLVIGSFLFIPVWDPGHDGICPILPLGWTLCYEMFFYLLFALSLGLSKRPVHLLLPLLLFLVGVSFFRTPGWSTPTILLDPILLEFVFGMVIALAVQAGRLLPAAPALILAAAMLLVLIASPYLHLFALLASLCGTGNAGDFRPLVYGVPSALLLYAALSLENPARRWLAGLPLLIGDASYSIYLSHSFVIPPLGVAWEKSHWTGSASAYSLIATSLVVSTLVGIGVHWFIENPLLHYLNKTVHQPDPVGIGTRPPMA